ncbi:MAG TPA: 2-oxoacid:acceptor oxidoreductase subunit alpha [Thermoanaerobaculia bacterium]|jgi:2-oxoglutarate ferredoxin oxidoreductase subunit alpha|nr:2-oxoacid:acceptor oxidoreductase subunit alpha [Thermoanaerobaculia bacterium]
MNELTFAFVGAGGDGAVAAGDIIAVSCAREGLHVIKTEAYGPQIRGGESSAVVRVSNAPIHAQADTVDALVVFSWADFARFQNELVVAPDAVIFHEVGDEPPAELAGRNIYPIAFKGAAKNVTAIAMLATLFGLPLEAIRSAVAKRFSKKKQAVIDANLAAFDLGIAEAEKITVAKRLDYERSAPHLIMSGNEATAFGAIHAGCRFFAGYPITPSTEILQFLADWLPKLRGTTLQTEDELAAIGAVIGGSFAGVKSMTATSGPGLALMAEMLGLASIAEIPAVIVNVQRGGPSTGIPTKSEQADLLHSVFASHGDTPRVVIACSDVEESFHATVDAFNISEEFQIPVIVLTDQSIAQRRSTIDASALVHEVRDRLLATPPALADYHRYRDTPSGVSPMALPSTPGGMYQTNGLEHDERGRPNASFVVHEQMNAKRYRKLDGIAERYPLFRRFGAARPHLGVICWGSTVGPLREAVNRLGDTVDDSGIGVFAPQLLMPLPAAPLQEFIDSCDEILIVELSYSAQFERYLRGFVDFPRTRTNVYKRSGGKNLTAAEIEIELRRLLAGNETRRSDSPVRLLEEVIA